jgi:hypothetical protein
MPDGSLFEVERRQGAPNLAIPAAVAVASMLTGCVDAAAAAIFSSATSRPN